MSKLAKVPVCREQRTKSSDNQKEHRAEVRTHDPKNTRQKKNHRSEGAANCIQVTKESSHIEMALFANSLDNAAQNWAMRRDEAVANSAALSLVGSGKAGAELRRRSLSLGLV